MRELTAEQRELLIKHGYDPNAAAAGIAVNVRRGQKPDTWRGAYNVLLRHRVCELDGILIDGHEGSDLDPGDPTCIHCGKGAPEDDDA